MSDMSNNIVVDKNDSKLGEWEDPPLHDERIHATSSNQPNNQAKKDDVIVDHKAIIQDSEEGLLSPKCCIYKVPHVIRRLKPEAYTPKVVSIGPFHYGNARLQNMERHKHILFKRFVQEATTSLDDLASFTKHSESKIRACYSEKIRLSEKELVKMILVDAGFIIKLFKSVHSKEDWLMKDAELSKPWLSDAIVMDLLLLENQVPFFFLEELYNRAFPLELQGSVPSFCKLTYELFSYYNKQELEPDPNVKIEHFADLLRLFHLPRDKCPREPFEEAGNHVLLYSASELFEAGVKFKVNKSKCLLDLNFSGRFLEIPQVSVEDKTETLFRNMIALEQCHYPFESYIIDYALLLDCLINTNKDVDVLVHEGIILHLLGDSNDVVKIFNGLGENIINMDFNFNFLDICKSLNRFYKDPYNNMKATLRRDYCKTPWQTAASIAAILLLILTLLQTIFSILP